MYSFSYEVTGGGGVFLFKHKLMHHLFVVLSTVFCLASCSPGETKSDEQVKENNDPEENRLVTTTVANTEITDTLELDLIGVPESYKSLPDRYKGLPSVGDPHGPDPEILRSLDPKEVLSVSTIEYDAKEYFEQAGVNVRYLNLDNIDHMHEEILQLGEDYDREEQAKELVKKLEDKVEEITEEVADKEHPKVLILMGVPGSYLVGTENSYIGNLVEIAGGKNVIEGEDRDFISSNTEHLQQTNPDVILRAAHGMPEEVVEMFDEEFKENDIWKHFDAVKNNRVYDLEESLFGTTGNIHAVESLDVLFDMLYEDESF